MKFGSFKKMSVILALSAIISTQTVHAHSSSSSSAGFEFNVSPFNSYHSAHVAINQIIADLNVAILAEALPITTTTANSLPTAYNQDIVVAAQNLQNALFALGGLTHAPIASAFDQYAVAAEQYANGTNTIENFQNIAITQLAQSFIQLSPSLLKQKNVNIINGYVQNMTISYVNLIAADQAQNFTLQIAYNHQIYEYANNLLDFVSKKIYKDN